MSVDPEDMTVGRVESHLPGLSPWHESVQVTLESKTMHSIADDAV